MSRKPALFSRRRFLTGLAAAGAAAALPPALAATRPVVVLTSYQDEVISRMEAAFEKRYPEYRLQIVWRMPHDAAPYLRQPGQGGVDVYWAASPRTFAAIARDGGWRKFDVAVPGLPERIGKAELADPEGYYRASEMAGYGFALDPAALARRQLPVPGDWDALADPRWAGLIALPSPAQVGFAPPMVEIVLQAYGWERGWAIWSEIAANARLVSRGATFVTDEIVSGRAAIGLSIDFFVNSAIANGAPLRLAYPLHNGINPGHVALTASAPNLAGARAFAQFVLSPEGQKILAHPDIRKLSVRPDTYRDQPAGAYDPFAAAAAGGMDYDSKLSRSRVALSTALFEQMLGAPHAEIVALWQRLRAAEASGKALPEVRRLLGMPPISETQAADATLRRAFADRLEGEDRHAELPVEAEWKALCAERRATAARLLQGVGA